MIDLVEVGRRLWESEKGKVAEAAEVAESAQPRVSCMAETWRTNGGNLPPATNPPPIRHPPAAAERHSCGKSAKSAKSAAPAHEVERIIDVLEVEVGRDLGPDLKDLMRRAMGPLDRQTRATLAAEIDDAFEHAASIRQAREQADCAIRGKVGYPPPGHRGGLAGLGRGPLSDQCRRPSIHY